MRLKEFARTDYEVRNYHKLDKYLSELCDLVEKGQASGKDFGMVAAGILPLKGNYMARLNRPGKGGRIHAEHAVIEDFIKKYGSIPEGSVIITTLSPCNTAMDERDGPSCADLLNEHGIQKVYCGYIDPTQHNGAEDNREYNLVETQNKELRTRCEEFADTFLDKVHENLMGFLAKPVKKKTTTSAEEMRKYFEKEKSKEPDKIKRGELDKKAQQVYTKRDENFADDISEARSHPEQNTKYQTGWAELGAWADKNNVWLKPHQWAISMTYMPKLGTNPGQGISEDTPRGIYFYPFHWAYSVKKDKEALPWADNAPYIQLFQYSTGAGLREPNQIPLANAVAELKKYGITDQDIAAEKENDPSISTYGLLVWCLGRKFDDNRRVSILNKVLRNLGYDYMIDNGKGWIAINEPTQGVVLNPEIINKVVTFNNYTRKKEQGVAENFADGRNPQDKGDSKRYHVPTKDSVSSLRKFAKGHHGRAAQLAHWMANMKSGHKK